VATTGPEDRAEGAVSAAVRRFSKTAAHFEGIIRAAVRSHAGIEAAVARVALAWDLHRIAPEPDVWTLFATNRTDEARWAAAQRLARRPRFISPIFQRPMVRKALAAEVRRRGSSQAVWRWVQEDILPVALRFAAEGRHTPGRIRLGRRWVKTRSGVVATVSPMDLSVHDLGPVLAQTAKRIAEELILADLNVSEAPRLRGRASSDLIALLTPARVARKLTARERELRDLLVDGATLPRAATRMGIEPSTARVLLTRIKQKIAPRV
jgi:DNA-binding CsgD family transcriptional regulator